MENDKDAELLSGAIENIFTVMDNKSNNLKDIDADLLKDSMKAVEKQMGNNPNYSEALEMMRKRGIKI